MTYVYLLESLSDPAQHYVGRSVDYRRRLAEHNAGTSAHTAKHRPWKTVVVIRFADDERAAAFERYLKSGSGHEFSKRHLWSGSAGSRSES